MKKRVLIHSLIFSPDGVSTAYLYNDIALSFQKKGYNVVVLSTTPHYNVVEEQLAKQIITWKFPGFCKQSVYNGIKVYHVPQKKFKSTFLRLLGFIYWHIVSFFIGLFIKNVDVILSPSPPLTIGVINILLAKLKGAKVIYNVQEIYPDILNKKDGLVVSFLKKMERFVYNRSNAVTTIDQVFYDIIKPRFNDSMKLHIIPNFVDTELYKPNCSVKSLDPTYFPKSDAIKLMYAGNIGFAQDWVPLVELAKRTKHLPVEFFVIGEGVMKSYIEKSIKVFNLNSIHLIPYQKRELMPNLLAYSDIQFIFMHPEMDKQGFPSKTYTVMSCGKPLLVLSGDDTPIVNFLKPYDCAKLITNKDLSTKVNEMVEFLSTVSRDELKRMGNNGVEVITKYYSKEIVTSQYIDIVAKLLS